MAYAYNIGWPDACQRYHATKLRCWSRCRGIARLVAEWQQNLLDAQALGIFGTPTYVVRGELFWGQDHLDFVDQALALAKHR